MFNRLKLLTGNGHISKFHQISKFCKIMLAFLNLEIHSQNYLADACRNRKLLALQMLHDLRLDDNSTIFADFNVHYPRILKLYRALPFIQDLPSNFQLIQ